LGGDVADIHRRPNRARRKMAEQVRWWWRENAWKYVSGLDELRSIRIPVHGFTVTPVVSFPHERVIVLDFRGSSMASKTGGKAETPIPAAAPAATIIL